MTPSRYLCPHCGKTPTVTKAEKFRLHKGADGNECMGSGERVPQHQLAKGPITPGADPGVPEEGRDFGTCNTCGTPVKLTAGGLYVEHKRPVMGVRCPESGYPYQPPEESCPTIDGGKPAATASPVPASAEPPPTPSLFQQPGDFSTPAAKTDGIVPVLAAPTPAGASQFAQPGKQRRSSAADPVQPMSPLGEQITAGLKQMFYHYNQRKTDDNRSAQTTLGPSEYGNPCDRRIAMSLLKVPAVNPGGDSWAAFVGTCTHVGLAEMFQWADAGTGRYVTEMPLTFPNAYVPRGTGDLLDRVLFMFDDHKLMGQWSLKKLRTKGATQTQRVQVHTYAYGARLRGEKVEHVALIGWPRDQSSLDDLYVWTEPYDPSIALNALKRVDDIAAWISKCELDGATPMDIAKWSSFDNSQCAFCPFHAPGDMKFERGCNGKQ